MNSQLLSERFATIIGAGNYERWLGAFTQICAQFDGIEEHLEAFNEYPIVTVTELLRMLPVEFVLTDDTLATRLASMPCFSYHVRCARQIWDPTRECFALFMARHPTSVVSWGDKPQPALAQIKAWLLSQVTVCHD